MFSSFSNSGYKLIVIFPLSKSFLLTFMIIPESNNTIKFGRYLFSVKIKVSLKSFNDVVEVSIKNKNVKSGLRSGKLVSGCSI